MRIESPKAAGKGGWIHLLSEPLPAAPPPKPVKRKADWTDECRSMYLHAEAARKRCKVADTLGVSCDALDAMRVGVGWDEWGREFSSWPSRDADGRCIGYIRRYADGKKLTNAGGGCGVFVSKNWPKWPGIIFIVEGGSDVAACESKEVAAIGRPSNVGGADIIRPMIARMRHRCLVVGERDEKPSKRGTVDQCPATCRGCNWCWPGKYGMEKVARELGVKTWMVPKPHKDIREYLSSL